MHKHFINNFLRLRNTRFGRGRRHRRQSETVFQPQPEQDQQTRLLQQDQQHQLIQQSQQDRPSLQGHQDQSEDICPTRKHFIHPTVAFSVKGKSLFYSNFELSKNFNVRFVQISRSFSKQKVIFNSLNSNDRLCFHKKTNYVLLINTKSHFIFFLLSQIRQLNNSPKNDRTQL